MFHLMQTRLKPPVRADLQLKPLVGADPYTIVFPLENGQFPRRHDRSCALQMGRIASSSIGRGVGRKIGMALNLSFAGWNFSDRRC